MKQVDERHYGTYPVDFDTTAFCPSRQNVNSDFNEVWCVVLFWEYLGNLFLFIREIVRTIVVNKPNTIFFEVNAYDLYEILLTYAFKDSRNTYWSSSIQ